MNLDMYRDESLNEDDPTQIESKFSIFESEIAKLFSNKILNNSDISLTSVYVNIKLGQIDILKLGHFLPVQPFFCNP